MEFIVNQELIERRARTWQHFKILSLDVFEDGILNISLQPPTPIGGWSLRWQAQKRFGGISGFALKTSASGYCNFESGIAFVDSGKGMIQVQINSADSSGLDYGNYSTCYERLDPGSRTILSEGFWQLSPGGAT